MKSMHSQEASNYWQHQNPSSRKLLKTFSKFNFIKIQLSTFSLTSLISSFPTSSNQLQRTFLINFYQLTPYLLINNPPIFVQTTSWKTQIRIKNHPLHQEPSQIIIIKKKPRHWITNPPTTHTDSIHQTP